LHQVYIVTSSNTGFGKKLVQILYSKHAKVYFAANSEEKALKAIEDIKQAIVASTRQFIFASRS